MSLERNLDAARSLPEAGLRGTGAATHDYPFIAPTLGSERLWLTRRQEASDRRDAPGALSPPRQILALILPRSSHHAPSYTPPFPSVAGLLLRRRIPYLLAISSWY